MVCGYPLQYYSPVPTPHYQPYEYNYYSMTEISEELIMPSSPHSVQSDSDNSMSSTDVVRTPLPPTPATLVPPTVKSANAKSSSEVKCGWRQCGLWFESLDQLASHVSKAHASSGPSGLFYCGWEGCSRNNKGFNARYKMLVHVRTHTNEKPHQCCQCDKSFSRAENLKIHSRSHSGEKPYVCPVPGCNKAYSNSSDRFKHTRTHQDEKPYLCKVPGCPKRYTDPSSLRKHVKTYKHFINNQHETQVKTEPEVKTNMEVVQAKTVVPPKIVETNNDKNVLNCSCPHTCCLKTCLSKAAELFKLGALINFGGTNLDGVSWNKLFLDPIMPQKQIYNGFADEQMDCDTPLDLTVHRK